MSLLFRHIESLQGNRPWGRLLDAGTGVKSLRWILSLSAAQWTAITASHGMVEQIRKTLDLRPDADGRLLVGNWVDDSLLTGETFDTVLLDYLVGAIEGFAPYWQDQVFERLRPLVAGRLYLVGLEPYVPFPARTKAGRLICDIGRVRDACLLLAGERPYREYPLDWVQRQLGRAGFRVLDVRRFPIRYRERFVNGQLDMCVDRLRRFASDSLAAAMGRYVEALRAEALDVLARDNGLRHGHDYVVAAEPM